MTVHLQMSSGDRWMLDRRYSVQEVTEMLAEARKADGLLTVERDLIPTGQKLTVDPRAVESVSADPW